MPATALLATHDALREAKHQLSKDTRKRSRAMTSGNVRIDLPKPQELLELPGLGPSQAAAIAGFRATMTRSRTLVSSP